MAAVDLARSFSDVKQISMSWGGNEFSTQSTYDKHFNVSGPVFFAASGDTGGVTCYPSASPYVVAVGGTSVAWSDTNTVNETGWSGAGGGPSKYYATPTWQFGLPSGATARGIPDLAAVADPYTGVAVYAPLNSSSSGWQVYGGTSVATPCMAAMVNLSKTTYTSTTAFLTLIYSSNPTESFRDITSGSNGYSCSAGWDYVTGLGSLLWTAPK
jgi:subtilase family serine protease